MTRVALITNASSGKADDSLRATIVESLGALGSIAVVTPSSLESFPSEVRAGTKDVDVVIVAGGDGSVNQTVNALGERLDDHVFGVVPMGTGNDLARTLGLDTDPQAAARALTGYVERSLDVGRASGAGAERLFLNACVGGFSVEVDEETSPELKKRVGPLAYWLAGAKVAARMPRTTVRMNDLELPSCVAVGIGNGRTAGGGIELWPDADPSDGLLDACGISVGGVRDAAKVMLKLPTGEIDEIEMTGCRRDCKIDVRADDAVEFNVDGELLGLTTPATFEVTGRLRILAP
ncbi:lipid kinase [soil metagenome]